MAFYVLMLSRETRSFSNMETVYSRFAQYAIERIDKSKNESLKDEAIDLVLFQNLFKCEQCTA